MQAAPRATKRVREVPVASWSSLMVPAKKPLARMRVMMNAACA